MDPCLVAIVIEAPAYRREILQGVGIVSEATGITFVEGGWDLVFKQYDRLVMPDGQQVVGWRLGDEIALTDPRPWFPQETGGWRQHQRRLGLVIHELLHWLGLPHNTRPDSILNIDGQWRSPRLVGQDLADARAATTECRPEGDT